MVILVSIPPSGWSGVQILGCDEDISLLQNAQTGTLFLPGFCFRGIGILFRDSSCQGMKVHLVLRLQWSYTISPTMCLHVMV